ncbi:hypothetical protein ACWGK7_05810 [Sphingomonas aurantiaca]
MTSMVTGRYKPRIASLLAIGTSLAFCASILSFSDTGAIAAMSLA